MPGRVEFDVETVSTTDDDPPGGSKTLELLSVAKIILDETVPVNVAVPLKPFRLVSVIVDEAEDP